MNSQVREKIGHVGEIKFGYRYFGFEVTLNYSGNFFWYLQGVEK